MARQIPEVVRAVAGLAATVLDEARKLPETLPGLPVRLIGQALQTSLKLQQQYSGLVARGDEVFTGLRGDAEPGLATFDDDLPAPPPPTATSGARSSAFDLVGELPTDTVSEELADELADDLAAADLPVADADDLSDEVSAAVLVETLAVGADDMSPAEVAELPDDPIADAVTSVVDELADEVGTEVVEGVPDAVPDEVLEDLTADTVAGVAEDEGAAEDITPEPVDETTVQEAVAEELIAEAAVGGTPPAEEAADVPALDEPTAAEAAEQTEIVDDAVPDLAALEEAAEQVADLGGPEAAQGVAPTENPESAQRAAPTEDPGADGDGNAVAGTPTSPVEGYDSFSIPALRGHLRAYPVETVADLLDYERATRARSPYVTLLQNRLEKLSSDRG